MEEFKRILVISFECNGAKCLFPIILNWELRSKAEFEREIINKIILELEKGMCISKVRVAQNRIGPYSELKDEFDHIIGLINYETSSSRVMTMRTDMKEFIPLTDEEINGGLIEKFKLHTMYFSDKSH